MKGYIRFLLIGALLFGVASYTFASDHQPKVEISKIFDHQTEAFMPQPLVVHNKFYVAGCNFVVERVDNEVLVILNENQALRKLATPVIPKANAPPEQSSLI